VGPWGRGASHALWRLCERLLAPGHRLPARSAPWHIASRRCATRYQRFRVDMHVGVGMVRSPHYAIRGCAPSLLALRCVYRRVQDLLPTVGRRWLSTSADVRRARPRPATITRIVIASGSTGA
jgi:hypothetical protein